MITIGFFNYLEQFFLMLFAVFREVAHESPTTGHDPPKLQRGVVANEVKPHWVWTMYG